MKTTIKLLLLVAIFATATSSFTFAQKKEKPFSGTIKFTFTAEGVEATEASQLPSQTIKISGNKQKTIVDFGPAAEISITDGDAETKVSYVDFPGGKIGYQMTKEEVKADKDKATKPTITLTEETKDIAGFKCKKAILVTKNKENGDDMSIVVWYSEDFVVSDKLFFADDNDGIKGMILGTEVPFKKGTLKIYATEIKKEKIKDIDFLLPAEAQIITKAEFEKMKGGGGGEE